MYNYFIGGLLRVQSRKQLISQIKSLNIYQNDKKFLLQQIQKNLQGKSDWEMVKKHFLALGQLSKPFTEQEIIIQIQNNKELRPFFINFLKSLQSSSLDSESFLIVLNLESLELKIMDIQTGITKVLIDQAE